MAHSPDQHKKSIHTRAKRNLQSTLKILKAPLINPQSTHKLACVQAPVSRANSPTLLLIPTPSLLFFPRFPLRPLEIFLLESLFTGYSQTSQLTQSTLFIKASEFARSTDSYSCSCATDKPPNLSGIELCQPSDHTHRITLPSKPMDD